GSGWEIFSIVGRRSAALDIDVIATQLHGAIPKDARAEVVYDGYRARLSVLFHSNLSPERCAAGEIFKAGVSITTADDGTRAIRVAPQIWRNLCKNLIVIDPAEHATVTRPRAKNLLALGHTRVERTTKSVARFADKWSEATVENALERYGVDDVVYLYNTGKVFESGCWAHTRRHFYRALDSDLARASQAIALIGELFRIERAIKDRK